MNDQDTLEVGVDWGTSTDASYRCGAPECGFETGIVEEIVKHMYAHGAHRMIVTPGFHPPLRDERPFDQIRRG